MTHPYERLAAVELEVPDLEREQLRAAEARRGEEFEHQAMPGVYESDDELHRLDIVNSRKRPRQLLVFLDPGPVWQCGAGSRVGHDLAFTLGEREARSEWTESVPNGLVGEREVVRKLVEL